MHAIFIMIIKSETGKKVQLGNLTMCSFPYYLREYVCVTSSLGLIYLIEEGKKAV